MTGRAPDMALDLVLWTGVKLEDADVIDAGVEQVDKYCDRLQASLDVMHVEIDDAELKKQRSKAVKEANNRLAHRFEVGDLVMVTVVDTSTNPVNLHKPKMRWQGPFTVVATEVNDPSVLHLRLLGYPDTVKPKAVHWTRCHRFTGKDFHVTPALMKSVQPRASNTTSLSFSSAIF